MTILDSNRVYLEEGEIVPVFCICGEIYQPEKDSECSDCPKCRRLNHHSAGGREVHGPVYYGDNRPPERRNTSREEE